MNLNKKTILIGSTAAVAGLAAIAGPALATGAVSLPGGDDDRHHEQFAQDLARELGVPQAQVDEALKSIQGDHLAERVDALQADGALTAAQASAIKAKIAAGDVDAAMGAMRTAMLEGRAAEMVQAGDLTQQQADQILALAAAGVPVGIGGPKGHDDDGDRPTPTAEEVIAHAQHEVEEGELTAAQAAEVERLATAGEVDEAMATMMAARTAATAAELVEAGTITQAQADQVIALANAGAPVGFGGPSMGRGHGGPGMHGDHGRGHHGDHGHHGDRGEHGGADEMGGAPPVDGMGGSGEPTAFDGA